MSGYSTFYCNKCSKKWESYDYNKYCLDCREFCNYVDMIMSMCLDYQMGGIKKEVLLNNLEVALPLMKKL